MYSSRVNVADSNKHSSLQCSRIIYRHKKFYNIRSWPNYKTFYICNFWIFIITLSVCPWQDWQPVYCLWSRPGAYPRAEHLKDSSIGQPPVLPTNIRIGWKGLPGCQCHKTFYIRNLIIFVKSYSVCPWQAFQPSLMFVGKTRSLPQSGA